MALTATHDLSQLLQPRSVAIVGASASQLNLGTIKLRRLREYGFPGSIYPIHPRAESIEGVPALRALSDLPEVVDYVYVTLPAPRVPDVVRAAAGRARFVQVASAGFSEVGNHDLERELEAAARDADVRLVGPNCLGIHSPAGRVTFLDRVSATPGPVAIASQSGGLGSDMIRRGGEKGIRYNAVLTLGNSVDVDVVETMTHFRKDPAVEVVGLYLETLRDGVGFVQELRQLAADKPVVVLRGGVTEQGTRSAASHTGGMATSENVWRGLCRQLGVISTSTLDEFLNVLVVLSLRTRSVGRRLALLGPGGGANVLASDAADRLGFEVVAFSNASAHALQEVGVPAGSSLRNPIDIPVGALDSLGADTFREILYRISAHERLDLLLLHLNLHNFLSFTADGERTLQALSAAFNEADDLGSERVLVLRSTGEPDIETLKSRLRYGALEHGVPALDSIDEALHAHAHVADWWERWQSRRSLG